MACASEDTFVESTAAKFLLDYSPLFDMYGVPSRLLFATCIFTLGMLDFSTHVFAYRFLIVALSSLLRTLSSLCRCVSLYFLTFGMACQ